MKTKGTLVQIGLPAAVLLLSPGAVQAQSDYKWTTNGGTITITAYTGTNAVVMIPDTITGLPVTSVGADAFFHATVVSSVTIPDSVTSIGEEAFQSCGNLASVTFGTNVASIGLQAFFACGKLTSVAIPASLTSIGEYAFADCTGLAEILVAPSNTNFTSVDSILFNLNQTTLLVYPGGLAGAYAVPSGVTIIGEAAFYDCINLSGVAFPGSVTIIGEDAFGYCRGLTSVVIGAGVIDIGYEAFADCRNLASVTIPAGVTDVEEGSFFGCTSLTNFTVNVSNPDYSSVGGILYNHNQTTLVDYPGGLAGAYIVSNSVTSVAVEAFGGNSSLTAVYIPSSVTSLGDYAFEECGGLTRAYFQGNAPAPGTLVFDDVNAAAKVYYFIGTTGWGTNYGGLPTVMLNPPQITGGVGVRNDEFGFTIIGTNQQIVVVGACTNLANPNWQPIQTNIVTTATLNFNDFQWTNFPVRFYRVGSAP